MIIIISRKRIPLSLGVVTMEKFYFHLLILIVSINAAVPKYIGDKKILDGGLIQMQTRLAHLQHYANQDNTNYQDNIKEGNGNINYLISNQPKTTITEDHQEASLNKNNKQAKENYYNHHNPIKHLKMIYKINSNENEAGISIEDNGTIKENDGNILEVSYQYNKHNQVNYNDNSGFIQPKFVNKLKSKAHQIESSINGDKDTLYKDYTYYLDSKSSERLGDSNDELDDVSESKYIKNQANTYYNTPKVITSNNNLNHDYQVKDKYVQANFIFDYNHEKGNVYYVQENTVENGNDEQGVKANGNTEIVQVDDDNTGSTKNKQNEVYGNFKLICNSDSCELETANNKDDKNEGKNIANDKGEDVKFIFTNIDYIKKVLKNHNRKHELEESFKQRCVTKTCKYINDRRDKDNHINQVLIEDILEDLEETLADEFRNNKHVDEIYYNSYKSNTKGRDNAKNIDYFRDINKEDIDEILHHLEVAMIRKFAKGDHNTYQLQCSDGVCQLASNDQYLYKRIEQHMAKHTRERSLRCDGGDRCDDREERSPYQRQLANVARCEGTNCDTNSESFKKRVSEYAANNMKDLKNDLKDLYKKQKEKILDKAMRRNNY